MSGSTKWGGEKRKWDLSANYPTSCAVQGQNWNIFSMRHALGGPADTPRHSIITEISTKGPDSGRERENLDGPNCERKGERASERARERRALGASEKARGRGETIPRNFYYVILAIWYFFSGPHPFRLTAVRREAEAEAQGKAWSRGPERIYDILLTFQHAAVSQPMHNME